MKRNLLSVALASATMMLAANAYAQSADQQTPAQAQQDQTTDDAKDAKTLDTVVVTGIRAGIERAIDTKRGSTEIVEAISAEDIGKLPDVSIAESIARLPGLAMQRVAGRSSTVSIRGLSDDFGTTLLNGREQVSVGHNRGVEFDQYPSELISGVVVYKTPNAELVGQGLSGTVDLHTVRPLDYADRQVSVNFRGEHNSNGDLNSDVSAWGERFSISYIDQFMDNTLGVAVGYAHLDTPGQANQWEAWGYPTDNAGAPGANLLGGSKSQAFSSSNKRDGLMGVIQYKPSESFETTLDLYYSKFKIDETLRFMETGLGWSGATLSNAVVENGNVVSGTFTGVRPVLRNDNNTKDDKLFSAGWNSRFQFNDDWAGVFDLSYSKAERDEMLLETYSGLGPATDPNAFDTVDFVMGGDVPQFTYGRDYTDPNQVVLTDPGGWGQEGFVKFPHVEDELWAVRADFERAFDEGMFSSLEFGLNYTSREKTRASGLEAFLCLGPNPDGGGCRDAAGNLSGATATIPSSAIVHPGVDLGFTGIPGIVSYNTGDIFGMYTVSPLVHQDVTNKNWMVNEDVTTAYAQLNINTDLGSVPMRGNIGIQAVHTDQSSDGFVVPFSAADAALPISGGATYDDYLPSLNLSFEFPAEQVLRVAAGRQLARPRMDWMRANQNVNIATSGANAGLWEGNGGNPELKPWEANAYDVSYEKYFGGTKGYVSVAGFYKDLRTWVTESTVAYDFTGYDPGDAPPPASPIGVFTTPVNGEGGSIYGWEFAASVPFDLAWDALDGFGLQGSYSDTTSNIQDPVTGQDRTIAGLSEKVWNITMYYEKNGYQARVSQRHRSPFLGEIQGFGADRSQRFINEEDVVDLQFGYSFAEGSELDGLSVLFQVLNATDEPYREYFQGSNLAQKHSEYGRTYMFGVTYKY
ncbi:TonB-dependent receptor [Lysobacter niabensis]|uniref:TonB-dependent receptor n=1 Tax=Agrilutibacter niabensis TaxID=380628 RepID=UPI00361BC212